MSDTEVYQLVVRLDAEHRDMLEQLAAVQDRPKTWVVRNLIEQAAKRTDESPARAIAERAGRQRPEPLGHVHAMVRKNAASMPVCECGDVLGKDGKWVTP